MKRATVEQAHIKLQRITTLRSANKHIMDWERVPMSNLKGIRICDFTSSQVSDMIDREIAELEAWLVEQGVT